MYLLQSGSILSKEKTAVRLGSEPYVYWAFNDLTQCPHHDYIPIGSVEFVTEFCKVSKINLPNNISYPDELHLFLNRQVWQDTFSNVESELFVKPIETKLFTGGIKQSLTEQVDPGTKVWVSEPIKLTSEFRCYIINAKMVGYSRYDDGDNEEMFNVNVINQMIDAYATAPAGYAIDVGIVNNQTVLIEVNDGWSLGLYPWGTMTNQKYVELITKRWKQIKGT